MQNPARRALVHLLVIAVAALTWGGEADARSRKKPKPKAKAVQSVTIKRLVEQPGAVWTEDETMSMEAQVTAQQQTIDIKNVERKRKTVEVLASGADAVTRVKLTYVENAKLSHTAGKETTKGAAVVGKSYVLELKDGQLLVTLDGGGKPTAEEIALVTDDNKRFGKPDTMAAALDGMTFKLGEKTPVPADKLNGAFGEDNLKATAVSMTLTEMRGTNAVFAMEIAMSAALGGPMTMDVVLTATAVVDPATDRLLELTMEGALKFSGQINGSGTMKGHQVTTYQ